MIAISIVMMASAILRDIGWFMTFKYNINDNIVGFCVSIIDVQQNCTFGDGEGLWVSQFVYQCD